MSEEQLAELKAAWPGEWRRDYSGYVLRIDQDHTVAVFIGYDGLSVVCTEVGWQAHVSSRAATLTEAVASFRAEARKVAEQYLALCGDAP